MKAVRFWITFWMIGLSIAACSFVPPRMDRSADILVVGDSVFAWHRGTGRGIPAVLEQASGMTVSNVAVNGARFLGPQGIPSQYADGDWDWVVVDGGGNDLRPSCRSPNGQRVLDALISSDGRGGVIPAFVNRVAMQGTQVIVFGYYPISDRGGPFLPCRALLDELAVRQALLAGTNPDVIFVDGGRGIGPSDAAAYAPDLVHPSPRGAALVGQLISTVIVRNNR